MTTKIKTSHTPGPWTYECQNAGEIGSKDKVSVRADDGSIALIKRVMQNNGRDTFGNAVVVHRPLAEVKANARLIAAAPDLLAALQELRAASELLYQAGRIDALAFVNAGNVIAKAEGK